MSVIDARTRRAQIRAVFDEPGLGRHIAAIQADSARRVTSTRAPDAIVTAAEIKRSRRAGHPLVPIKGSIMVFWARPGSDVISRLGAAYTSGDLATLQEVGDVIERQLADEPIPTLDDAAAAALASPMHFEVRYGSKVLAHTLSLPEGAEIGLLVLPFNGGAIEDADFALVQHHRGGETVEYPTLVVKVPPALSAIEIEAMRAVPSEQVGIHIGDSMCCPAATALVLVAVALATHAGIWQEMGDEMNKVHLSASQIKRLGPLASAQELVAVRREILEAHGF